MAYQTGIASSPGDLLVKLFDFAGANGWTIDEDIASDTQNPPQGAMHKGDQYVSFYFFSNEIKIYPARGYNGANDPGEHPESFYNDSLTTQNVGKCDVTNIAGPLSAYHFFSDTNNLSVVIHVSNGLYRHFGFCNIEKFGDWSGGEFYYSHYVSTVGRDQPSSTGHNIPFSGSGQNQNRGADVFYAENNDGSEFTGAPQAATRWWNAAVSTGDIGDDADGRQLGQYIFTTSCTGGWNSNLLAVGPSAFNGFRPMFPVTLATVDITGGSPFPTRVIGTLPNIRIINSQDLADGAELTVGADTWVVFPLMRKEYISSLEEFSGNCAIAYKKVV